MLDQELVKLYVNEYRDEIEPMVPDLAADVDWDDNESVDDVRDSIQCYAADYMYDREQETCDELREAARIIAGSFI